jgi:hypothetical protein
MLLEQTATDLHHLLWNGGWFKVPSIMDAEGTMSSSQHKNPNCSSKVFNATSTHTVGPVNLLLSMAPLLTVSIVLAMVYLYPLLLARRQHKYLYVHVIAVAMLYFCNCNFIAITLHSHPSLTYFACTNAAVHILHSVQTSLQSDENIYRINDLLLAQSFFAGFLRLCKWGILACGWLLKPDVLHNLPIHCPHILYLLFIPELIGLVCYVAMSNVILPILGYVYEQPIGS